MTTQLPTREENREAASTLFEFGAGALRAGDRQMAKILLCVAEEVFKEADEPRNAAKARDLRSSIT